MIEKLVGPRPGDYIQKRGAEFGATTGRKRRCGWLDLFMARDAARLNQFAQCEPVYEELPGWHEELGEAQTWKQLPAPAQKYLKRIEEITGVPISIVSIGPGREETIVLQNPFQN